jgi:hypothetical protein
MINLKKAGSASWLSALVLILCSAAPAACTTIDGFEADSGTVPTYPGMTADGWYTPTVSGTSAGAVYSYSMLAGYGIAADPAGGNYALVLAQSPTGTVQRAQTNVNFRSASTWTIGYDLLMANLSTTGDSYGTDWIGSFAPQSITANFSSFFVLDGWDSAAADSSWSAFYFVYDASGNALDPNGVSPGAAWTGLNQNHWYTESTTFSTVDNEILSVAITDITAGVTTTVSPTDWYMYGGAAAPAGLDSIRLRGYGASNAALFDNVTLSNSAPEPAAFAMLAAGLGALACWRRRARPGVSRWTRFQSIC